MHALTALRSVLCVCDSACVFRPRDCVRHAGGSVPRVQPPDLHACAVVGGECAVPAWVSEARSEAVAHWLYHVYTAYYRAPKPAELSDAQYLAGIGAVAMAGVAAWAYASVKRV